MTIGYAAGEYFREEISTDRIAEMIAAIDLATDTLRRELEIVPAAAPTAPSEIERKVLAVAPPGFFDPVYVSRAEALLLVSDDLHYRNYAKALHGVEGAWVQACLMAALQHRCIDSVAYAKATCDLAMMRHGHVSLNGEILVLIAEQQQGDALERLGAALAFVGNETADLASHLAVGWEFIASLWVGHRLNELHRSKATGMMLERIVPMLDKAGQLQPAYAKMVENSGTALKEYLLAWAKGHFLQVTVKASENVAGRR